MPKGLAICVMQVASPFVALLPNPKRILDSFRGHNCHFMGGDGEGALVKYYKKLQNAINLINF